MMIRRICYFLSILTLLAYPQEIRAQQCYRCVADGFPSNQYSCQESSFGYRSCTSLGSNGCTLQFQCGPTRSEEATTASWGIAQRVTKAGIERRTEGSAPVRTVFAALAPGRNIERGCDGRVIARSYTASVKAKLREDARSIRV